MDTPREQPNELKVGVKSIDTPPETDTAKPSSLAVFNNLNSQTRVTPLEVESIDDTHPETDTLEPSTARQDTRLAVYKNLGSQTRATPRRTFER